MTICCHVTRQVCDIHHVTPNSVLDIGKCNSFPQVKFYIGHVILPSVSHIGHVHSKKCTDTANIERVVQFIPPHKIPYIYVTARYATQPVSKLAGRFRNRPAGFATGRPNSRQMKDNGRLRNRLAGQLQNRPTYM